VTEGDDVTNTEYDLHALIERVTELDDPVSGVIRSSIYTFGVDPELYYVELRRYDYWDDALVASGAVILPKDDRSVAESALSRLVSRLMSAR
jgi:hypothetical protein